MEIRSYKKDIKLAICIPQKELEKELAHGSAYIAVLKFFTQRPSFDTIWSCLNQEWDVDCDFWMSLIDPRHVVIWFDDAKELDVALARNNKLFMGICFKIFRWMPGFSTKIDPRVHEVWIDIPFLKYEYFTPYLFQSIGDDIGQYLAMDAARYH